MLSQKNLSAFLDELATNSPAPGGGSVASLAGALGSALTTMVCNLTVGKKKYASVEAEMKNMIPRAEALRKQFTRLIDQDTDAFSKVREAYGLPRENEDERALRSAANQEATKE